MNKHLYRLIFNELRGQFIVVAENVLAGTSPGAGSVTVDIKPVAGTVAKRCISAMRPLALLLNTVFGIAASLAAPAYAQIIADPNAPGKQRPTVLQTANGVVQVNVQTPSEAGVSRNTYSQFDVTRDGAVLNNSRNPVQTQVGGWIQGNPWLLRSAARVILNEVNSSNPSQLRGYLEVAGQRAEIVIANPSGIDVDGAGFINASRVTLTTGVPRLQDGNLEGILVQQGRVTVTGQGLDAAQTDYAGILARAVTVNANIWAKELRIVTGANQIDATAAATPAEASGSRPVFALDVAQLGGMYAGNITLIGTEAGVGVRNAGTIEATSGNLVLNANGWLTNSGSILASARKASTEIEATGDITNSGKLYAAGDINVTSRGDIASTGLIAAQNNASVLAAGATSRIDGGTDAIFASGLMADGTLLGTGDLSLMATSSVTHHGTALGGATMQVSGSDVAVSHATLTGDQINVLANAGNLDASGTAITAKALLVLNSAKSVDTDAAKVLTQQLRIGARDWSNVRGEVLQIGSSDTDITLTAPGGTLDNTSGRIAVNSANLTLGAGTLVNTDGKIEHAATGTLAIRAQTVSDQRGKIIGNGALDISAADIDHRDATTSASQVDIAAASLDNYGGHITQVGAGHGAITVSGRLANSAGTIESNGDATVNASALDNSGGRITAIGSVAVGASAGLNNADGLVAAGMHLALQGGHVDNSHGTLQAQGGDATLRVNDLNNAGGSMFAAGRLDTVASNVANTGTLYAGGDQILVVGGAVVNSGVIAARGSTSVSAQTLSSDAGSLLGAGLKNDGSLAQTGALSVTTTGGLAAHGQNLAGGQVRLHGGAVDLSGSQTSGASIALHASDGDVTTTGAVVATAGTLAISAAAAGHGLVNRQGMLSGGQLEVQVANLDNRLGTLIQSGSGDSSIAVSSPNGVLDNTQGRIAANGNSLRITAPMLTNVDGHIEHAGTGTLTITATNFNDERGSVASNGMLALTADVLNHDGAATWADGLSVHAGTLSNRGGHLLQSGTGGIVLEVTHGLDNVAGQIAGVGPVSLRAGSIENNGGQITSGASAQVSSLGILHNSDGVLAAGHSLAVTGVAVDNTRGTLQSGDALTLDVVTLQNSKGVLSAGTDLTARIAGELSNDSVVYARRNQILNVGGTLTNTGSIAAQGDTTIVAASVDSSAGSLLGAGIRVDGTLAQSGSLTVQATGKVVATGQNLAAGNASLNGASVDVRGSDTAGGNVALAASSGDVHTAGAKVSTSGTLSVAANQLASQVLDNVQGNLSAGQLALNVANLDNTHGTVIQTGAGDANITVSAQGRLDNTAGHIAVNSANLTLGAGTLVNTDGKIEHAGAGTLAIRAGTLNGPRGRIVGNGAIDITATAIDHRDATTFANQIAIAAASLDNRSGHIAQLGTGFGVITVSGNLDNGAGTIESNGDAAVNVGFLDNRSGRITAAGSATIGAGAGLNNAHGLLAAGMHLAVEGGNVDNSGGTLQAQGGDATVRVGDLNNTGGIVYAAGKLDTVAANIANSGSLYAGGDLRLEASGAVTNSGVIAAQGSTTVNALSLSSDGGSLLGAGVKADGTLAQTGDLSITTTAGLAAHGQNLAAGRASLQGAMVDVGSSQTSGAGVALRASAGDVTTSGATVATAGTLALTATTEGHGLVNSGGTLSGGQLDVQLANLDNRQGTLIQSGTADSSIELSSPSGALDNTGGRIAVNSRDLRIGAATLTNVNGQIEHAGTGRFDLAAGDIYDQHGEINGNGVMQITTGTFDHREAVMVADTLIINASTLDNSKGLIVQKGSANTSIRTTSTLNNSGGTIASNGNTTISASALNNASGTLTSADAGNLTVQVGGNVDNGQGGLVAAAGDVAIRAGAILNQSGKINSGGIIKADAIGAIQNANGSIIAHGNTTLTATQLTNTRGTVASEIGNINVKTTGVTQNDSGVIQAGGDLILTNNGLSNARASGAPAGGSIVGRNVDIDSNGQASSNHLGTIASSQNLSVHSGVLNNAGGLIQSGEALLLDTHGGDLNNSDAGLYAALHFGTPGGIVSGGNSQLRVGKWNNAGGFFGTGGRADAEATGKLDNKGGQIVGASDLGLTISSLDNQGGQIQSLGSLAVRATAGSVNNSGGLIRSGATLDIFANGVDNSNTKGTGQGLAGRNIVLTTPTLNNDGGAILADENADIKAGISVINTQGLISAGKTLTVGPTLSSSGLSIENSGGTLIGGSGMNVKAASLSGAGHLLSLGDLALDLSGDFVHAQGGELVANKSINLKVAGNISNSGKLSAGSNLALEARNVDNSTSAEISSSGLTHVTTAGTLRNRGLIDGSATEIDAGTVDNSGTGHIYGGNVSIAADLLNNDVEGGIAATIAARSRLDIGVQTLNNREHALIFSAGDLAVGGALDASRLASGNAGSVTNASASIEALGNLSLSAEQVNNLNNHFSTELRVTATEWVTEYSTNNNPSHYSANSVQVVADKDDPNISLLRVGGSDYETWAHYDFTRTTKETVITKSDPGRIAAGGSLSISADGVLNDNSHLLAGGFLGISGVLTNTETLGQRITSAFGTATDMWRIHKKGTDEQGSATSVYALPDIIQSISVKDSRIEEGTASVGGSAPGMTAAGGVARSTSSAGNATADVNAAAIVKVSTTAGVLNAASGKDAPSTSAVGGATGTDLSDDAARLVSLGSATGEHDPAGLPVSTVTGGTGAGSAALSAPATVGIDLANPSGPGVGNVRGVDPSARAQAPGVTKSGLEQTAGGAQTVRTSAPSTQLPATSLFQVDPSPSAGYLVETDPRFVNYQQWTGSDYMLAQTKLDPALTQKRLGDGFYEQKLVRDQVAQLTGQRFLGDYTSDDEQFRGLMDVALEYAKELNLRPGVALTAEQMGSLTKDMVWLVAQEVTLADGTVQKVLAPQVYVASHDQDLTGAGAVISGRDVKVASTGNLTNTGSIFARNTAQLVADNINNLGGRIHADSVLASAKTDINNIAGTILAGHALIAAAGRDINVETTTRSALSSVGGNQFSRTTIDRIGSLSVTGAGGTLVASAGRDINLVAAKIDNAGKDGDTLLNAGRNLNLATVTTASSDSVTWDPVRYRKESSSTEVGTVVQGAGAITFKAGTDINLRAASVDAGKDLTAIAGNNLNILAGISTAKFDETSQTTKSGFLHRETITTRNTLDGTSAIGSVLGGATVNLSAGHDLKVVGSSVVGDNNVNLVATNAISIEAATNQSHETHYLNVKESGLLGGGGFGISFGKRTTTTNQDQDASTQSGLARSTIGSIAGNLTMSAGDAIKIAGSDLAAGHDINLRGKSVSITPGVDDVTGKFTSKMTQDALTLSLGGSVVNAIQSAQAMSSAAGQTSSGRLKALAAASAAMTAKDAAQDLAKNGPSVKVSLTVGHSESESTEVTTSSTHGGSVLAAGNNVIIGATGGGKDSNIDIVGSDVRAKGNVSLAADNQVNLLAAHDAESQHSQSKSWSAAVGVAAELSSSGPKYGVTASASASRGNVDGEGTTQVNSHVSAGDRLTIASGGDTNLKGAVASASQVVADVKGNLNIESLQDTATLDGKRQSASVSGTVGAGAGFSANVSQSKVHNDFASVQEQSGIRAGDGGFQVQVVGNTDLKGGVISSSEQAIKDGRNSLATGTLSFSDIQNRDSTEASGVSLGVNVGKNQNGSTFSPGMAPGIGQVSGNQGSVTRSGISGATLTVGDQQVGQAVANLNRDVSTGKDTAQALTKGWTGAKALDEVGAQMQITSAALPRLAKEIGDYAESKAAELNKQGNSEEAAKWAEGGIYRVAAHTALGAMGGGLGGAAGAAAAAEAAPTLGKLQDALHDKLADAGLSNDAANVAAKLIAGGTAATIGGVAGGSAGAATGLNADVNNRQLHPEEKARIKQLAGGDPSKEARLSAAACALVKCYAEYPEDSAAYKQLKQLADFGASDAFAGERAQLSTQPGMFVYSTTGMFNDANIDAAKQLNNTYQIGTRLVGTGKMVLGVGGVAGSAVTAPLSCATVIGCFANGAAATISLDTAYSGAKQLVSGNPTETYLNQGLQSLGMSPQAAAWVEAGLGIGSAATAGLVANKAVDQALALNKAAAGSYSSADMSAKTAGERSAAAASERGVAFFGKDNLHYYVGDITDSTPSLGAAGRPYFMMPIKDSAVVTNPISAAVESGMAPSAQRVWNNGGDLFGVSVPLDSSVSRLPVAADAKGWVHFLEGGNTAVNVPGTDWFIVNRTREFVIDGGAPIPKGSVVFRVGDHGEQIPLWRY